MKIKHMAAMVLLVGGLARAQASEDDLPRSVFGPGEQTTYEVSYLGLPTGMAQVTVGWKMEQFGREVWPLVCVGQTTALAAAYQVKDRFVSYWDPRDQRTVGSDFFLDENHERRRERYRYDFERRVAFTTKQREGREATENFFDIEAGTLDLASTAFRLRNVPLVVGAVHEIPVFTGARLYRGKATVVGRQTVETKLGSVEAYRVTINGEFSGQLATKGLMTVYFTADEKQLPVRAEADFLLGSVVVDAVKYAAGRTYPGAAR